MEKSPDAFRTISEVADDLDVPQHVLRFWESRFREIKPMKRGGGRRYYRPDDVSSPARHPASAVWRGLHDPRRAAHLARAGRQIRAGGLAAGCAATWCANRCSRSSADIVPRYTDETDFATQDVEPPRVRREVERGRNCSACCRRCSVTRTCAVQPEPSEPQRASGRVPQRPTGSPLPGAIAPREDLRKLQACAARARRMPRLLDAALMRGCAYQRGHIQ